MYNTKTRAKEGKDKSLKGEENFLTRGSDVVTAQQNQLR